MLQLLSAMLAVVLRTPAASLSLLSPDQRLYRKAADAIVNTFCTLTSVPRLVRSLYYNIPAPGYSAAVAVAKTPPPDYHLVSEAPALPALQPIEIVRQPSSAVAAQDGMRQDGFSAAMRIEVTPPGYVVQRHQHLPAFSGEIFMGQCCCGMEYSRALSSKQLRGVRNRAKSVILFGYFVAVDIYQVNL